MAVVVVVVVVATRAQQAGIANHGLPTRHAHCPTCVTAQDCLLNPRYWEKIFEVKYPASRGVLPWGRSPFPWADPDPHLIKNSCPLS